MVFEKINHIYPEICNTTQKHSAWNLIILTKKKPDIILQSLSSTINDNKNIEL